VRAAVRADAHRRPATRALGACACLACRASPAWGGGRGRGARTHAEQRTRAEAAGVAGRRAGPRRGPFAPPFPALRAAWGRTVCRLPREQPCAPLVVTHGCAGRESARAAAGARGAPATGIRQWILPRGTRAWAGGGLLRVWPPSALTCGVCVSSRRSGVRRASRTFGTPTSAPRCAVRACLGYRPRMSGCG